MSNVLPTLKYIGLTIQHKWFVFRAGLRVRAPLWNLFIHDWSKFTPSEAPHYGRQFYGDRSDPGGFARAWIHHQNLNPHHWEYWIPRTTHDRGGFPPGEPIEMPEPFVREMIADWLGASRAYDGQWPTSLKAWSWFQGRWDTIQLHPNTRNRVLEILREQGL